MDVGVGVGEERIFRIGTVSCGGGNGFGSSSCCWGAEVVVVVAILAMSLATGGVVLRTAGKSCPNSGGMLLRAFLSAPSRAIMRSRRVGRLIVRSGETGGVTGSSLFSSGMVELENTEAALVVVVVVSVYVLSPLTLSISSAFLGRCRRSTTRFFRLRECAFE